jgi:hypothetical protein
MACDEESWIAEELWRRRNRMAHGEFVTAVVMLLRAAQRDGRGALKPRRVRCISGAQAEKTGRASKR